MKAYPVNILPFAKEDLYDIFRSYLDLNPAYAESLYRSLRSRIQELERFPERGPWGSELELQGLFKYRQLVEANYRIIYSSTGSEVFVHLIVDSRRNLEEVLIKKLQMARV